MDGEEFVRRLEERQEGTGYAFLLGAGCSISSGIPSAGILVKDHWLPKLHRFKGADGDVQEWAKEEVEGYDPDNPGRSYGRVMEAVFPSSHDKQKEVERICRGRDPGFGCCVLAKLIEAEGADFNVILTTNFDDLIADALYLFTESRPLVISHGSLAPFMLADPRKPLVAKLHGDHQLQPLNTADEVAALSTQMDERMRRLLQQRGLIVMGYAGNDDSVMGALEGLPGDALGPGVWWVSRSAPNKRVSEWLVKRSGRWVQASDFDQLMLLIRDEFDLAHPEISRWDALQDGYFEAFDKLSSNVRDMAKSEPAAEALKLASDRAIEGISDWWAVELEARKVKKTNPAAAADIYERGLERIPNSHQLAGNYANFLATVVEDYDKAEKLYRRALDLDPDNARLLTNYGLFLKSQRDEPDKALGLYERALHVDPKYVNALISCANLLVEVRGEYDRAEELYQRALDVDPDNANALGNYAGFMEEVRRDPDEAEAFYTRAVEAASDDDIVGILGNYAIFMTDVRRDFDRAEDLYRQALERDPENVALMRNYAIFMKRARRDNDRAESLYKRALEIDPDSAQLISSYAVFLTDARGELDEAAALFNRALELDSESANIFGNLARTLIWNGDTSGAMDAIAAAFDRSPLDPPLEIELWFYLYANGPESRRVEALGNLRRLVGQGVVTPGWDFSGNVEQAEQAGHPESEWLAALVAVLAGSADEESLSGWGAWKAG